MTDCTDTARSALLWVLWHHQGSSSDVGQPIRFALGMGQTEPLTGRQIAQAKRWQKLAKAQAQAQQPRRPQDDEAFDGEDQDALGEKP